jgi:predicted nucleic acid-binding protein
MVLADTSVWVDHFRGRLTDLGPRLNRGEIIIHPFVIGELMLSGVHRRPGAIEGLRQLRPAPVPSVEETEALIAHESLDGRGVGYVDVVILAAVRLQPEGRLWTLDRKLHAIAVGMSIAFEG